MLAMATVEIPLHGLFSRQTQDKIIRNPIQHGGRHALL
jgi:hypothetical protein